MAFSSLAVAASLIPAVFQFGPGASRDYRVLAAFDGFIPLMGGVVGQVEIDLGLRVSGLAPVEGNLRTANEITAAEMRFGGAPLPFGLEDVKKFFPKTNVVLEPTGNVVKNDAPNVSLPIRLPGLDVKRFPDLTYLPVIFPKEGISEGLEWQFEKDFGGSPVRYQVKVASIRNDLARLEVKVHQEYKTLEDAALQIVADPANATAEVTTVMNGRGEVLFDLKAGQVRSAKMTNDSVSTPRDPKTGKILSLDLGDQVIRERKLASTLTIGPKDAEVHVSPPPADEPLSARASRWWEGTKAFGNDVVRKGGGYAALAKLTWRKHAGDWPALWREFSTAIASLLGQLVPIRSSAIAPPSTR